MMVHYNLTWGTKEFGEVRMEMVEEKDYFLIKIESDGELHQKFKFTDLRSAETVLMDIEWHLDSGFEWIINQTVDDWKLFLHSKDAVSDDN